MISVSFHTLGCKVNQIETEAITDAFRESGCTILPWMSSLSRSCGSPPPGPDLCIINTCTVTSKADQKARRIIRLCLRSGCTVLITGCYAQMEKEALEKLGEEGTLFVFPGQGKERLLDLPRHIAETFGNFIDTCFLDRRSSLSAAIKDFIYFTVDTGTPRNSFSFNPKHFLFHSRAFLKIQDGCDRSCTYCRVPLARGRSTSLGSGEILRRLKLLEEAGMAEAVLSAVNISQYQDPETSRGLPDLLRFLLDNTSRIALRLSSLEPEFFESAGSTNFFSVLANGRIRNHFHFSVQSGSDTVLAAMGRQYHTRDVLRSVEKLKSLRDDPFLACDIITGFPGETAEDFERTLQLCRTADFAWIHAFPYSKRPGTAAAKKKLASRQVTARERMGVLLEIARQSRNAYVRRWEGKTVEAVAESSEKFAAGKSWEDFFPALTDNYVKVLAVSKGEKIKPGTAFRCRIGGTPELPVDFDAWAEPIDLI
ncbi:MAG: MiaB/RimO family radical SAM methylthiotransferase [Treponema sp.]|nr:MiaB/RimO family radical SAM methylthiotransferase [Treponema sp.]